MIILSICIVLGVVAMVAGVIIWAWAEMLLDRIFQEMSSKDAKVLTRCFVKQKGLGSPCIAGILNESLIIRDISGHRHNFPLNTITIKKDKTVWLPPWFGKRVFKIKTEQIKSLSLGVKRKDSDAWNLLSEKQ